MKKTKILIAKLLEEIEKTGTIQIACDKNGISRNTFYRWMKEDKEFLEQVRYALALGVGLVSDVAISNILNGIKSKDMKATTFWLTHRHPDFRRPYVHRIDADDLIAYERSREEGVRKDTLMREIEEMSKRLTKEEQEEHIASYKAFQGRWQRIIDKDKEDRAKELFEQYKKEWHENGEKPPETT